MDYPLLTIAAILLIVAMALFTLSRKVKLSEIPRVDESECPDEFLDDPEDYTARHESKVWSKRASLVVATFAIAFFVASILK